MRYTPYTLSLGAIGRDKDNFAIFKNYDAGFKALLQFLRDAQSDLLRPYKGNPTLLEFFKVYAPSSDNNNPLQYAEAVAKHIGNGVTINTPIKELGGVKRHRFNRNLRYGMRENKEVVLLQDILKKEGVFTDTVESTGNYYNITRKAVLDFQLKHKIPHDNLQGRLVGVKTRRKLNELY